jgi:hypothetical protein
MVFTLVVDDAPSKAVVIFHALPPSDKPWAVRSRNANSSLLPYVRMDTCPRGEA